MLKIPTTILKIFAVIVDLSYIFYGQAFLFGTLSRFPPNLQSIKVYLPLAGLFLVFINYSAVLEKGSLQVMKKLTEQLVPLKMLFFPFSSYLEARINSGKMSEKLRVNRRLYFIIFAIFILSILSIWTLSFRRTEMQVVDHPDTYSQSYLQQISADNTKWLLSMLSLDAIISVLQNSDLEISVIFLSGTLALGQVLDPINNVVENFSKILLASTVASYVLQIIFRIGSLTSFILVLLFMLSAIWDSYRLQRSGLTKTLLFLFLVARFYIPSLAFISNSVDTLFLRSYTEEAKTRISSIEQELNKTFPTTEQLETRNKTLFNKTLDSINKLKQKTKSLIVDIVKLIVSFVIKNLLLPILSLWILVHILFKNQTANYHKI